MSPETLIRAYVDDIAQRLPRSQRSDLALELTMLLTEELDAKSAQSGRLPDEEMALVMLNAFGRPDDVAARYRLPSVVIIDPEDTRSFLISSSVGIVVVWVFGLATVFQHGPLQGWDSLYLIRDWWFRFGLAALFWWPGLMMYIFASRATQRRIRARRPEPIGRVKYRALDRDRASRWSAALGIATALIGIVIMASPTAFFAAIMPKGFPTSWIEYRKDFAELGLPVLIGCWIASLIPAAVVVCSGRWFPILRRLQIALDLLWISVLMWLFFSGPIYQSRATNDIFKAALLPIALSIVVLAWFQIRREMSRNMAGVADRQE
jgi:hypothetical protein